MRGSAIVIAAGLIPCGALGATQEAAPVPDSMTLDRLKQVFEGAYIDAEIDADGDLQLSERNGIRLWVQLDDTRGLLNFFTVGSLRPDATQEEKLVFLNELNRSVIGATFYLAKADLMIADSYLSFQEGVSDDHVINAYRWFRDAVLTAIQKDYTGLLGRETRIRPRGTCGRQQPDCVPTKT